MSTSQIIDVQGFDECIEALTTLCAGQKVFCVIDPAVFELLSLPSDFYSFITPKGESAKTLATAERIWGELQNRNFGRKDFLVAIGGGAISDLGGFVASTYKRGNRLIHVPTTIIGAVDASIGGKTAIDFCGVKNMIGTFYPAEVVIMANEFFDTLSNAEVMSGWGEILKYALLSTSCALSKEDLIKLEEGKLPTKNIVRNCQKYKMAITAIDLEDNGQRQFLNLGHTVGHALEALMMKKETPVPHGCAVAVGLVVESYLSLMKTDFPQADLMSLARLVKASFEPIQFRCNEYDMIRDFALQDKKNKNDEIRSVLLAEVGKPLLPQVISENELFEALDFYRDFMGV